ncbi:MAG: hypothetical protein R5N75_10200 [Cutibacterium granulosum]|uniref:hypothetical protein n=1 Tax=Cutibacterium granulosum TaxID=33011 RepID=UPI002B22F217|nr:hypothetical protein [Cutibacterium granulosum]MEA5660465.1 hypothetical protein [Cutibacterium granulosum]
MTTTATHLSNISTGFAEVWRGDHILGTVERVDWPHEVNGFVEIGQRWEARAGKDRFTVNPFSFPSFMTRREAVDHLAETY